MVTKQTKTGSAKNKTGPADRTTAKTLSKKTPSAKSSLPLPVRAKHATSKAKPVKHPPVKAPAHVKQVAPKIKPGKQPPVKATLTHASIDQKTLDHIRLLLIRIRDRLAGQIHSQSNDSLKYVDDASSEDRTDDFDRELALNIVSSEHDALFEVNSALRRIDDEVYGLCDACNLPIEKNRLNALPFTRMCIKCQSEHERGRHRFRPFGETISQYTEPAGDAEEAEVEEHE